MRKKLISLLLVLAMVLTMLPIAAFAADEPAEPSNVNPATGRKATARSP